jgi:hypothetical protein
MASSLCRSLRRKGSRHIVAKTKSALTQKMCNIDATDAILCIKLSNVARNGNLAFKMP